MNINADFTKPVVLHSDKIAWVDSPIPGVQRKMLDRIGDELARATSIVRYAPGSQFSPHTHGGGEEFIVLQGVFQDEHGDYPAGTYIRNPPTSRHTPRSDSGCIIFVKLWQFDLNDRAAITVDTNSQPSRRDHNRPGVQVLDLFKDTRETVQLETWESGLTIRRQFEHGAEILVLSGGFNLDGELLRQYSWIRIPIGGGLDAVASPSGAKVWIKTRHLRFVDPPAAFQVDARHRS